MADMRFLTSAQLLPHSSPWMRCVKNIIRHPVVWLTCRRLKRSSIISRCSPSRPHISRVLSRRSWWPSPLHNPRPTNVSRGRALTAFVNIVLAGRCPSDAASVFFGGRLYYPWIRRPEKFSGFTLRRLASKYASSIFDLPAQVVLSPIFTFTNWQFGTPGGCGAAIYSARMYLEALPPDHSWSKLILQTVSTAFTSEKCSSRSSIEFLSIYAYQSAYSQSFCLLLAVHCSACERCPTSAHVCPW